VLFGLEIVFINHTYNPTEWIMQFLVYIAMIVVLLFGYNMMDDSNLIEPNMICLVLVLIKLFG